MKSLWIVILIAAIVVLAIIGAYWSFQPIAERSIQAQVTIDNKIGFNLDTDKLYFGRVPENGFSSRDMMVSYDKDAFVIITAQGDLAPWIYASEDSFFLPADTSRKVTFNLKPASGMPLGKYSGVVIFSFYRPFTQSWFSP